MELYLRSVEFIFLLLPMTTVDIYHMERVLIVAAGAYGLVVWVSGRTQKGGQWGNSPPPPPKRFRHHDQTLDPLLNTPWT